MFASACAHAEDNLLASTFDLKDKEGNFVAKMKIVLSRISGSGNDNIEEFLKKVDDDVSPMSGLPNLSTPGQILKLSKGIVDKFSQVVHFSSLNLIIINRLIELIRPTRYSMHRGPLLVVFTR
jgi:hypothetical protein